MKQTLNMCDLQTVDSVLNQRPLCLGWACEPSALGSSLPATGSVNAAKSRACRPLWPPSIRCFPGYPTGVPDAQVATHLFVLIHMV